MAIVEQIPPVYPTWSPFGFFVQRRLGNYPEM